MFNTSFARFFLHSICNTFLCILTDLVQLKLKQKQNREKINLLYSPITTLKVSTVRFSMNKGSLLLFLLLTNYSSYLFPWPVFYYRFFSVSLGLAGIPQITYKVPSCHAISRYYHSLSIAPFRFFVVVFRSLSGTNPISLLCISIPIVENAVVMYFTPGFHQPVISIFNPSNNT